MPTIHPATAFTAGKRVTYFSKKSGNIDIKAKVKKILADEDKVILIPENGPNAGDEVIVPAKLLTKLRGPEPGTKRTPKVVEEEGDDEVQTSAKPGKKVAADTEAEELSLETMEEMLGAFETMSGLLRGHIAFIKAQTSEKPAAKKGIMGKRAPMAEDDEEV